MLPCSENTMWFNSQKVPSATSFLLRASVAGKRKKAREKWPLGLFTRPLRRAMVSLLKSADGWSTAALANVLDVCEATITNVRRRFAQGGLEMVLHDKVQQHRRGLPAGGIYPACPG